MNKARFTFKIIGLSLLLFSFHAAAQNAKISAIKKHESTFLLSKDKATYKTEYGDYAYHPASWTIAASFATKKPKRKSGDWDTISLPFKSLAGVSYTQFYQKNLTAYLRKSAESEDLVLIFSGSNSEFAGITGGSWVNRTAHYIDEVALSQGRKLPNIIAFDGYFHPKSLAAKPIVPPLTTEMLSKDVFLRITDYTKNSLPKVKNWAAFGFSGGATIAVTFTRAASSAHALLQTPNPFKKYGTMAFSPVVNGRTAMRNMDKGADLAVDHGGIGERHGFKNRAQLMYFWSAKDALDLVNDKSNLDWYQALLYNNFVSHVLYDVVEAYPEFKWKWGLRTDSERDALEGNRFSHFFVDYAFKKHQKKYSLEKDFDEYSCFISTIQEIKTDIYMVFSLDDMLLLRHPDDKNSDTADLVKGYAQEINQSEHARLFVPERGGHLGYLVDGAWYKKIIHALFSANTQENSE